MGPSADPSGAGEVALSGVRAEFREALRQEIDAARRNATSAAVPLVNGRRIAQVGSGFQYIFDVDSVLNAPGDAPGDLIVAGQPPVEVIIISVDGLAATISVPKDLGGFVPAARLQSNLTQLMRRLITRIEAIGDGPNPAGERIRGAEPVTGSPAAVVVAGLNAGQSAAVASSLGRDTTFIWGPPGTGKTRTIGTLGGALFARDRSLLMVSHTNTAVDQALLKIADELTGTHPEAIANGKVLRVGDPADPQLRDRLDLLLGTHVARRSEELAARRAELVAEHEHIVGEVLGIGRRIAVVEWVAEVGPDLVAMTADLAAVQATETELVTGRDQLAARRAAAKDWAAARVAACAAVAAEADLPGAEAEAETSGRLRAEARTTLGRRADAVAAAEALSRQADELEPYRIRASRLPDLPAQTEAVNRARLVAAECVKAEEGLGNELAAAEATLAESSAVGALARRWKRLPTPDDQQRVVDDLRVRHQAAHAASVNADRLMASEETTLAEVAELDGQLSGHAAVPRAAAQEATLTQARRALADGEHAVTDAVARSDKAAAAVATLRATLAEFAAAYDCPPAEVIADADADTAALEETRALVDQLARHAEAGRAALVELLAARIGALREWGLTTARRGSAEDMLTSVAVAHRQAATDTASENVVALRTEQAALNARLVAIEAEVVVIDEQLKKVEELVIAEAAVIATTLTRAYLRDSIQARRFDTVILDEASMAPIPALWVAASLADVSVVAVGDYKQLPPIVMATTPEAEAWLGRDIFTVAGITDHRHAPAHFVALTEQFRMHPSISAIANNLVYDGLLTDGPGTDDDSALDNWYRMDWGHDSPVLVVDTAATNAWVTSVTRGERASRLNFLSATICVDLAEQLLRPGRSELPPGTPARILIVSPYRPHAKLVELLLREGGLTGEIRAGTAHTFQGSEADVVILDLVNDEPHWKVNLFIPRVGRQHPAAPQRRPHPGPAPPHHRRRHRVQRPPGQESLPRPGTPPGPRTAPSCRCPRRRPCRAGSSRRPSADSGARRRGRT